MSGLFTALALIAVGLALAYGGLVDMFGWLRRRGRRRRATALGGHAPHSPVGDAGRAEAGTARVLVYPLMIAVGLGLAILGLASI